MVGLLLATWLSSQMAGAVPITWQQNSSPAGFIARSQTNEGGTAVSTTNAPFSTNGYRFTHWTLNATAQRDLVGRAFNPVSFTILEPTTATAQYLLATEDTDADQTPDWWEIQFHDSLTNGAANDADADGYPLRDEYRRDQHPALADTSSGGGLALHFSSPALVLADTNLVFLRSVSYPPGFEADRTVVTNRGALVDLGPATADSNGFRFVYWQIDGQPATDQLGRATALLSLTLQSNTTARAFYVAQTQDADTDGLADWFEYLHFQDLDEAPANDADGDGASLLEEYRRDWHPGGRDRIAAGGISVCYSAAALVIADTNLARFARDSSPAGLLIAAETITNKGQVMNLPDVYGITNTHRFAYWTLNGAVQTDLTGRAFAGPSFVLASNTLAEAFFVAETEDGSTNGVPDWFEYHFFAQAGLPAGQDDDGDSFSVREEYRRDLHPRLFDRLAAGGLSLNASAPAVIVVDTNLAAFDIASAPPDLITSRAGVTNRGALLQLSDCFGLTNGYRFTYWTVDGIVQTDALGRASGPVTFALAGNTSARAAYVLQDEDLDEDGLPDWYELHFFGNRARPAGDDADGDGLTLRQEFLRDYHPRDYDRLRAGGVSVAFSEAAFVDFRFFPRVEQALVNGLPENFFSTQPPALGSFAVAGAAAPALGDWDGDGDLDLLVGGTGGVLRVFENSGSPVIMNWVERTTNFSGMAAAWTNRARPRPALGDWSGDGRADLAIGDSTGRVRIVSSSTNFLSPAAPAVSYELAVGGTSALPAFAQCSADTRLDLLVLLPDGTVNVFTNSGSPTTPFALPAARTNLLGLAVPGATGISVSDVTDDGRADLLISDRYGSIWEFHRDTNDAYILHSKIYGGAFTGFANDLAVALGDVDGDGDTDVLGGFAPGGLVYLRNGAPHLLVTPPSYTLLAGQTLAITASGNSGLITWQFITNRSGATLDAASGIYTAGPQTRVTDVIEARDASGLAGRTYMNVIGTNDVSAAGRAVIIAGGKSLSDPVWRATDRLADLAFNTLRFRGYSKENIHYLSFDPLQDADGNGTNDDIDLTATLDDAAWTFTNWVGQTDKLFVYLTDHGSDAGGQGFFRLNGTQFLTASNLNLWLDQIQNTYTTEVTVVLDFCYAGSFLDELAYTGTASRVVVAATDPGQLTYFIAGGLVSFSDAFFGGLRQGFSVGRAFALAGGSMALYQTATLDDDQNGLYQPGVDGPLADGRKVGASFIVGRDIPWIGNVMPDQTITGETALVWAADLSSAYPLTRIWCAVVPPDAGSNTNTGIPVVDVPEVDLIYNPATRRYEKQLTGLTDPGTYRVSFHAQDVWGSVSLPKQCYLTQGGYDERALLLVAGDPGAAGWSNTANCADVAYTVLRARQFASDRIQYLCAQPRDADGDGTNDVDEAATRDALGRAITNWAAASARLTVYLVGTGRTNQLVLADADLLADTELDAWLDAYQLSNRAVNVVLEFEGAGAFITNMTPAPGRERILIASTRAWGGRLLDRQGAISFSQYFWSQVFGGRTIGDAFQTAGRTIRRMSGELRQRALLNDDGDALAGEKSDDGPLARTRYIGTAFLTGDDAPGIGSVVPPAVLVNQDEFLIWAAGVSDVDGISNVWCVVTDPGRSATAELLRVDLVFQPSSNRYEALLTGMTNPGTYVLTFYADDARGNLSEPVQSELIRADAYEVDDVPGEDTLYYGPAQFHNFHHTGDVDWVRFYAVSNYAYDISTFPLSTNCDTILSLYREETNGALTLLDSVDDFGSDDGELLGLDFPSNAFYAVQVTPYLTNDWQPGSYELDITIPAGGGPLIVRAYSRLYNVGATLPPGVVARVGEATRSFNGQLAVTFDGLPGGVNTVVITNLPTGYRPAESTNAPGQVENPDNDKYGNPRRVGVNPNPNTLTLVYFTFIPTLQALGRARDLDTGAWVDGAAIEFTAPAFDNLVYTRYPSASYASPWLTGPDGSFPTNVLIPTTTYNLKLSKAGYSNLVQTGVISAPAAGSVHDLGERLLAPVDANGNAIADTWETLYFGGPTTATNDADDDGHSDLEEYWTGTNPTNASSVFESDQLAATNGFTLRWPVTPGRVYRVLSTPSLVTGHWSLAAGPWTAAVGQATMQWTDSAPAPNGTYYGVQVHTR
jgi:hypothetical protein